MATDQGYDNPFGAFGDINFNIDDDEQSEAIKLLEAQDLSDDSEENSPTELAILPQTSEVLTVRPTERKDITVMTPEEVSTELTAYNMPTSSLSALTGENQARLLQGLRDKQDINDFQTIGAMQLHGQVLPPALLAASAKLSETGIRSELLTPEELIKVKRFSEYRPEDTDEKLRILLDIITQSKNAVRSRRDFADIKSQYYNREKAEILEGTADKINDYLDQGGYSVVEEDPEYVSDEEREYLISEYGNDPFFTRAIRSELIDSGYLDEGERTVLGPLSEDDLSAINSVIAPSYAPKVSHRSIKGVSAFYPDAERYFTNSKTQTDITDAMLGKYVESEVTNERTLEPKALLCGFLALEKEFFESGFTERIKEFLSQNPNSSIEATLTTIRRRFMHGGRYCNLLTGGKDSETREHYGTMVSTNPQFIDELLQKAQDLSDADVRKMARYQSGFIVKLDSIFDEVRIAYSGLKAILENPQARQDSTAEQEFDKQKGISEQSIRKMLDVHSRIVDESQFTGEADIRMPDIDSEQ